MKFHRRDRVADQILRDASQILFREVKDSEIGFVTLSRVEVTKDLRFAKIYYTAMGSDEEQARSSRALYRCRAFMQSRIGKLLGIRHTPEISFEFDKGLDHSLRVNELINRIENERKKRESGSEDSDRDQPPD